MPNSWTTLKLIEWTSQYFTRHEIPNPRLDAELLLAHTLGKKRIDLYLAFEEIVSEKDLLTFKGYIQRRTKREPLQYIIGIQDFCGVQIKVTPAILIPRPETELLVEQVLNHLTNSPSYQLTILDLCTGSGAIAAALADKLPKAHIVGIDISDVALKAAGENTLKWQDRVELLHGNLFEPLILKHQDTKTPKYDIIVSNPPYVSEEEWPSLQPEIRNYEPKEALVAGNGGLAIIKKIINDAHKFLKLSGWLAMEIGDGQAEDVKKIIANTGKYSEVESIKDYAGIERIIWTNLSSMAAEN